MDADKEKTKTNTTLRTFYGELSRGPLAQSLGGLPSGRIPRFHFRLWGGRGRPGEAGRAGEILQGEGKREGRGKQEEHR